MNWERGYTADMAKDLTRNKRIRAGHRPSATRILNQIDGALAAVTPDSAKLSQPSRKTGNTEAPGRRNRGAHS